ncbi:hypothetical protein TNCV_2027841 [Trichonephila clavipes]|nr:hypothetical protein TNCV_2027841 [Trichonephila clavipes]
MEIPLKQSKNVPQSKKNYSAIEEDKLVVLTSLVKIWTPQQKVQCVFKLAKFQSVTRVQRRVRIEWNVNFPTSKSIHQWDGNLTETGN